MSGIPLYRQPSSIEKILGDAEMEHQSRHYYGRAQYQIAPAKPATTVLAAAAHASSATAPTTPAARERERDWERDDGYKNAAVLPLPPPPSSPPPLIRRFDHDRERQRQQQSRAESTAEWRQQQTHPRRLPLPMPMPMPTPAPRTAHAATTRQRTVPPDRARAAAVAIQAAFRGYSARRSYRSLRGLIRLQAVVRGPSVRRQTAHAMRCMQTLVRVQAQVRASRVEAMERRNGRHSSSQYLRDAAGRWRNGSQDGGIWDDSLLSRDEAESRTKRRAEAVTKRERALAYAYSHQVLKATPMAAHAILADLQSGRSPWWWAPIDRSYEPEYPRRIEPIIRPRPAPAVAHRDTMPMTTTQTTTAATTPARSVVSAYSKPSIRPTRVARGGAAPPASVHGGGGGGSIRDDESLTSCPAFGVPNYMTPTLSASAKARARAHVLQEQLRKEQRAAEQKPRFSFGLGQSIGSWAKSPFWKAGGGGPQQPSSRVGTPAASVAGGGRHRRSVSGLSVDSTVSMPAGIGRRSFK